MPSSMILCQSLLILILYKHFAPVKNVLLFYSASAVLFLNLSAAVLAYESVLPLFQLLSFAASAVLAADMLWRKKQNDSRGLAETETQTR